MNKSIAVCAVLLASAAHGQGPTVSAAACEDLAGSLSLPNTTVTAAQPVSAGEFTPPGASKPQTALPPFCRVALTIEPSRDSDIKSEVWMPISGWNGKFLEVGNGAWGGSIQYAALADALRRGYAAASTDTGHTGTDASFAVGHPEKLIDFGYRSIHETAVQGKATVAALFGKQPTLSYFEGCSGGGRQSFMEAQRFPEDFDGIIAGAPGFDRTDAGFQTIGMAQATHMSPESYIPPAKYPLIHEAAIKACDQVDGLEDGLISEPARCDFDPGVLQCRGADSPSCLTEAQVAAARKIYAAVIDPRTGELVSPGLEPGSELNWSNVAGEHPHAMYSSLFRFVVFKDPDWDYRTLDVAKHLDQAREADGGILAATSTNLTPFVDHGGRLLIYHGWADQNIPPRSSVNYYKALFTAMTEKAVEEGVRLYMVPGMGHCGGGYGPNEFDMLSVLEQWRERGRPPKEVVASLRKDGRVVRTRPLCPYPQIARYKGSGSIDKAENFVCAAP
jgi:feruloyl esterase